MAPFVALLGITALVGACGSTGRDAADSAATTSTSAPGAAATTLPPTTVPAVTTVPAGGKVPSGFDPVSFTAVSPGDYWLLGDAPCTNPVCTSIVRTTDGGSHFVGIPALTSPLLEGTGASTGINTLRFADDLDGYAFATGPGGQFWDTHDGGGQWQRPAFLTGHELLGFGTGDGYAFALVGSCQSGSCSAVALERSPVSSEQWSALTVPVPAGTDQVAAMTARQRPMVLADHLGQPGRPAHGGQYRWGAHFATSPSPCFAGLGAVSRRRRPRAVGNVPHRDDGRGFPLDRRWSRWEALSAGELENSARLSPASYTTAVIQPAEQGELLRTDDGGRHLAAGRLRRRQRLVVVVDRFHRCRHRAGLEQNSHAPANWPWPNGLYPEQLWRTGDGGSTWSGPVTIGG